MIDFDKYRKRGDYHWRLFAQPESIYRRHVLRVQKWVRQGRMLDIGAGDGLITYLLNAEGIDADRYGVEIAKAKGVMVELGDAYNLSGYFGYDNVLMLDVLEHLEYPEKALAEVGKVLNDGGLLYITTPPARENGKVNKYHYREYTPMGLVKFMSDCGWDCVEAELVIECKAIYGIFKR